ncbi:MAG: hypothetical protein RLZZ543_2254 [Bacteroidota bacterium]|jgi:feruloyl esterase
MAFRNRVRIFFLLGLIGCLHHSLPAQLQAVSNFGSNPGELRCFIYVSKTLPSTPVPLLMVLHGCGQTAEEVANQSGWNKLADSLGMIIVYPQQHLMNNPSRCFNWFVPTDIRRGSGEVASLHQMIDYCQASYSIDEKRVFVFGLSAGAVMGTVLMAAYPEEITAGCALAGPAIGTWEGSLSQMRDWVDEGAKSPTSYLAKLHAVYPEYHGTYPLLISVQGTKDVLVTMEDQQHQIFQWSAACGADGIADKISIVQEQPHVQRSEYTDANGKTVVIAYQLDGVGHVLPIKTGDALDEGGKTGLFTKDVGFHLPYWVAREFGLIK